MADKRRCPACGNTYAKYDEQAKGGLWLHLAVDAGSVFLCSQTCRTAFAAWPEPQQRQAIFGDVGRAGWAIERAKASRKRRGERTGRFAIAAEHPAIRVESGGCLWQKAEDGQTPGDDRAAVEISWKEL